MDQNTEIGEKPGSSTQLIPCGLFSGNWNGDGVITQYTTGTSAGDMFGGHSGKMEIVSIG